MDVFTWSGFWFVLLALTFVTYLALTLVVTVGGFRDIGTMLGELNRQHKLTQSDQGSSSDEKNL